jgi:hypothetical protein
VVVLSDANADGTFNCSQLRTCRSLQLLDIKIFTQRATSLILPSFSNVPLESLSIGVVGTDDAHLFPEALYIDTTHLFENLCSAAATLRSFACSSTTLVGPDWPCDMIQLPQLSSVYLERLSGNVRAILRPLAQSMLLNPAVVDVSQCADITRNDLACFVPAADLFKGLTLQQVAQQHTAKFVELFRAGFGNHVVHLTTEDDQEATLMMGYWADGNPTEWINRITSMSAPMSLSFGS